MTAKQRFESTNDFAPSTIPAPKYIHAVDYKVFRKIEGERKQLKELRSKWEKPYLKIKPVKISF